MITQSLKGKCTALWSQRAGSASTAAVTTAVAVVTSLMLVIGAVATLPYGYFQFLRVLVCGCAAYLLYLLFASDKPSGWMIAIGIVAVLFNPFLPIYLPRVVWQVLDVASAVLLVIVMFTTYGTKAKTTL